MTPARDQSRAQLEHALGVTADRIHSAEQAILRAIVGGMTWNGEMVRRHRNELERALLDRWVVTRALRALDDLDGRVTEVES